MSVVPKKKTSPSRRNQRRAHDSLKAANGTNCTNCQAIIPCHTMCNICYFYKGQLVKNKKSA